MPAQLEGVSNLQAVLKALPDEIEKKVVRNALLAGARVVAARMRASCPIGKAYDGDKEPGFGRRSIRARMATAREIGQLLGLSRNALKNFGRSASGRAQQVAIAGVSGRAWYLRLIEFGWVLTSHGKHGARKPIKHIAAKPFLRPAYEAAKGDAAAAIRDKLETGINEAAAKLAGPYATSGFSRRGRTFIQ